MNINLRSKGLTLSDSMREYIDLSLNQLVKYNFNIHHVDVSIIDNNKKGNSKFEIEYIIKVDYQKDSIILKNIDSNFHSAVDGLTEKSEKTLRRLHSKKVSKRNNHKEEFLKIQSESE